MTSENIENIKTTRRTSRIRSKITERTTGTRSKKKLTVGLGSKLQT